MLFQEYSDNFNQADGPLSGSWTNLNTGNNVVDVGSNQAKEHGLAGQQCIAIYSAWAGGNDQYCQATLEAIHSGTDTGLTVRATGTTLATYAGYIIDINSTDAAASLGSTIQCSFYRAATGGSFFQIGSDTGVTLNASDIIRFEVSGSNLRFLVNGVERMRNTDTNIPSGGVPGLYFASGATNARFDNFTAGGLLIKPPNTQWTVPANQQGSSF